MTPIELVLSKLPGAKRNGRGWIACCPGHDDQTPSLSIKEGDNGGAVSHCFGGCANEAIVAELGLTLADLMPSDGTHKPAAPRRKKPAPEATTYPTRNEAVAELDRRHGMHSTHWTYVNAKGGPVGVVVRWNRADGGKDILPVSRRGTGWVIGGMPTPRPLYCLPELAGAENRLHP